MVLRVVTGASSWRRKGAIGDSNRIWPNACKAHVYWPAALRGVESQSACAFPAYEQSRVRRLRGLWFLCGLNGYFRPNLPVALISSGRQPCSRLNRFSSSFGGDFLVAKRERPGRNSSHICNSLDLSQGCFCSGNTSAIS